MTNKRRYTPIILFVLILLLTGCQATAQSTIHTAVSTASASALPSNDTDNTDSPANNDSIKILGEINSILETASKGSGNQLAVLGGFSDQLDEIKTKSEDAIACANTVISKMTQNKNQDAGINTQLLTEQYNGLNNKLSEIKTAKKEKDITLLKTRLGEFSILVDDYTDFLQSLD